LPGRWSVVQAPAVWPDEVAGALPAADKAWPPLSPLSIPAFLLLLDPEAARIVPGHRRIRIIAAPEFTDASLPQVVPPLLETILHRARGRRICCLVGSIDRRKGVKGFLKAAALAPVTEWFFVMAGRVAWHTFPDEIRDVLHDALSTDGERVMLVDQWIAADTLNAIIQASDLLHACYEDWPYSSNMLCKAAALGTPVIGSPAGYIGRNLSRYELGFTPPPGTQLEGLFVSGFGDLVAAFKRSDAFAAGCRRYLAANDHAALVAAMDCLLSKMVFPFFQILQQFLYLLCIQDEILFVFLKEVQL